VAVSPVPFQVAMLGAGFAKYSVWKFVLATAIARGIRYFGPGLLVCLWGRQATDFWEQHKMVASSWRS
jgi:membrane protein YqaA with SNARE-associated domain